MKRVLHVVGKLDRGGIETWLLEVLRHIDPKKCRMDFVVHTSEPGAYDGEVRGLGGKIFPCLSPSSPIHYARNFFEILNSNGPYDVVHSHVHHFSGYVLMLAALHGVRTRVAQSHTGRLESSRGWGRRMYLALMRQLIGKCSTTGVAVSELAGDSLFPGWRGDRRWQICPCGIDLKRFEVEVDPAGIRAELGIPRGAKVVGHVGRFVDVKNHDFIVKVAAELLQTEAMAAFLLVGDGPRRSTIEEEVARRGISDRFVFTGVRDDVPALLKGAMDAFLFPSKYEGLPVGLMEAQVAGLPCVASDAISAEAEFVKGNVHWLSLNAGPKRWAAALKERLDCCEKRMLPDGIREQISIEGTVERLSGIYGF